MHILSIVAGIIAIFTVLLDAFETVILPRRASGKIRLTRLFYLSTWTPWRSLAARVRNARRRETAFSFYGPLSLILLIATWALGLVLGFGLIFYGIGDPFSDGTGHHALRTSIYVSGTTLFTLGLGDVLPKDQFARELIVVEAGMGLGFVAVVIGYLPVLYAAFSRREVNIALLDGRAGSPPTAAELLRRHAIECRTDALVSLLSDWERWSAELLESHISYPLLCYFRSQHDNQSWLSALTAILDTTALLLSLVSVSSRNQAQLTFAMARHAVVDLILVFGLEPHKKEATPLQNEAASGARSAIAASRLSDEQLEELIAALTAANLRMTDTPQMRELFRKLRGMYEAKVLALSDYLSLPVPPFLSTREKRDQWMQVTWLREIAGQTPALETNATGEEQVVEAAKIYVEEHHPF